MTPASVMGDAVSVPEKAMTGRPQAIPATALPRREEMPPRTNRDTWHSQKAPNYNFGIDKPFNRQFHGLIEETLP